MATFREARKLTGRACHPCQSTASLVTRPAAREKDDSTGLAIRGCQVSHGQILIRRATPACLGSRGTLDGPRDIEIDKDGTIFVVDGNNHRIAVFDPDGRLIRSFGDSGTKHPLQRPAIPRHDEIMALGHGLDVFQEPLHLQTV
ncbi:MAG: hypothetical protein JRJ26_20410, partial [Deltaproteobacteria bacterium]|nr:hypothetical protein [Deltaproteobacteria bacterium]